MRVHFIAIGGSVMHNLAIALKLKGYHVTGSDDEIFEPAKSHLAQYNLLPPSNGWDPSRVTSDINAIVLGMHAKPDNPELLKAQDLNLRIFSFPEFVYQQSKNRTRVVIAGSHGKTTITAMIMHILRKADKKFDYMVGSSVKGFDINVRLSDDAPVIILEGDEYPDSAINKIPKFHVYQPNLALISGVAWDHINMFPTFEIYVDQFRKFVQLIPFDGALVYNSEDRDLKVIVKNCNPDIRKIPYHLPPYEIADGVTCLTRNNKKVPLRIFGRHNLQNLMGAVEICKLLGLSEEFCFESMSDFVGASRRLEKIASSELSTVFRDFAHAPSKLRATIAAVREQFPDRKLVACFELHTYSSLDKDFLGEYFDTMKQADVKVVFYNAHTFELKRKEMIEPEFIYEAFGDRHIHVITDAPSLEKFLKARTWKKTNLLMMSSGSFGGIDINALATFVTSHR
ncbi:MAG: peptidoglycan synthetase [Chitinophagales bacterium]|nr:peptidoglycan synthetase [Chitinophagales bacterium]